MTFQSADYYIYNNKLKILNAASNFDDLYLHPKFGITNYNWAGTNNGRGFVAFYSTNSTTQLIVKHIVANIEEPTELNGKMPISSLEFLDKPDALPSIIPPNYARERNCKRFPWYYFDLNLPIKFSGLLLIADIDENSKEKVRLDFKQGKLISEKTSSDFDKLDIIEPLQNHTYRSFS